MTDILRSAISRHLILEQKNLAPESDKQLAILKQKMTKAEKKQFKREIHAIEKER